MTATPSVADLVSMITARGIEHLDPQTLYERIQAVAEHDRAMAAELIFLVAFGTLAAIRDGNHNSPAATFARTALIVTGYEAMQT